MCIVDFDQECDELLRKTQIEGSSGSSGSSGSTMMKMGVKKVGGGL